MEDVKIQVCRLCFALISDNNFFAITRSLKDMLQIITTDLNLSITNFPVMCSECLNSVQDLFSFKTNFFESEEIIDSKISGSKVKCDLSDLMNNPLNSRPKRKLTTVKSKRKKLCRTCLGEIKGKHFILLNKNADVCLSLMLDSCLSELDINLTSNPVMCRTCYETLQRMSVFKTMCHENESKIEVFLKTSGANNHKNINLHSVLQFSLNTESNTSNREHVKMEPKHEAREDFRLQNCLDYVMVKMEPPDGGGEIKTEVKTEDKPQLRRSTRQIGQNRNRKKCVVKRTTHCSDCNFKTKYKYNLRRHLIVTHRRKDVELTKRFYQCPECNFATRWNLDLTRHMLSHVKPEAFQCTRCPYSTNQNSHLVKHILSHVNADNIDKHRFIQSSKKTKV